MRSLFIVLLLLLLLTQPASGLMGPIPPNTLAPTDPDGDGRFEDLNGNSRLDFNDVVLFFNQMDYIATNEPLTAFDFNNNGRIDFSDIVTLFNRIGNDPVPTPTVTGSVLASQTVVPSAEDQTITAGDLTLTIPGGALNQTSLLRIATVSQPPAPPAGTGHLVVYDITIGDQIQFNQPLRIEYPYDPATISDYQVQIAVTYAALGIEYPYHPMTIPAGGDPSQLIQGISWDSASGGWRDVPTAVDTARQVVILAPDHLCQIGYYVPERKQAVIYEIESDHFVVHYDPADDTEIAEAWNSSGRSFTSAKQLASSVDFDLELAYKCYVSEGGFKPPVTSRFSFDNKIHVYVGNYGVSEWNPFTKNILISQAPFIPGPNARDNLKSEMRHELFHAVQNAYVTTGWMHSNRWWIEATADYAATYYSTAGPGSSFPMDSAYFKEPLTTVDGFHEYQTAHLIDLMVDGGFDGRCKTFHSLWTGSIASFSALDGVRAWCREEGGQGRQLLEVSYRNLMMQQLLLTGDPRSSDTRVRPSILNKAKPLEDFKEFTLVVPGQGTGAVSPGFRVSTTEESVMLLDAWAGIGAPLPDGCLVTRFIVNPDGTFQYQYTDSEEPHLFSPGGVLSVQNGAVIFYSAVSVGNSANIDMALTKPDVRIFPEQVTVEKGDSYLLTVSVKNVPFNQPVTQWGGPGEHSFYSGPYSEVGYYLEKYQVKLWGIDFKTLTTEVTVVDR